MTTSVHPAATASPRAFVHTTVPIATGTEGLASDAQRFDPPLAGGLLAQERWMGWRLRILVAAALIGSIGLFLLARWLASTPHLDVTWQSDAEGRIALIRAGDPALEALQGHRLVGIVADQGVGQAAAARRIVPVDVVALQSSARWLVSDADRMRHATTHAQIDMLMVQPTVHLAFDDGSVVEVRTRPRGYSTLGPVFWLLCGVALVLYLVAMVVLLARPSSRNLLYAVMALCQTGNLLFIALESALGLAMPPGFVGWDLHARVAFDLLTSAALVNAAALHPTRLPRGGLIAAVAWVAIVALLMLVLGDQLTHAWWWVQAGTIAAGATTIGLLSWSYRIEPHPFAVMMRRFGAVALGSLLLLTAAVAASDTLPEMQRTIAGGGSMMWYVFFTSLLLLVPMLSRSQQLMREFSLLAGVSTVATSLDLLFVTVFSFGQFTSLTLSLFVALGGYAGARQWLLNQLLGSSMLTTERMFEQLYRIAREVEAHPQTVATHLSRLLRELFEPLEAMIVERPTPYTRISGHGSTLIVPVPDLDDPSSEGTAKLRSVVLRFARRGRRLFTLEDARLTDRVVEQLRRAIAFDKAVEQGRSEERARLAQDLHDDIGARLLTLMYKAQTPEIEDYARHTLQDLKTLTRGLAASNHRLSHAAAEWKADLSQRLSVAHIELAWMMSFDEDAALTVVQWSGLTRVLRELVTNVIAHAQATRVTVDFTLEADQLDLMVSDNGAGRNPRAWAHGLGLGGVRKRVKQLGGEVEWLEMSPSGIACKVRIRELTGGH